VAKWGFLQYSIQYAYAVVDRWIYTALPSSRACMHFLRFVFHVAYFTIILLQYGGYTTYRHILHIHTLHHTHIIGLDSFPTKPLFANQIYNIYRTEIKTGIISILTHTF
jgi:hypothetical protein